MQPQSQVDGQNVQAQATAQEIPAQEGGTQGQGQTQGQTQGQGQIQGQTTTTTQPGSQEI